MEKYKYAFDLDGVIALLNFDLTNPLFSKSWSRKNGEERKAYKEYVKNCYKNAVFGFDPTKIVSENDPIIIITARKNDDEIRVITEEWISKQESLIKHKGGLKIHYLNTGRSVKNVIEFKNSWISHYGIEEFYEDNKKILKGISLLNSNVNLNYVNKNLMVEHVNFCKD